MQALTNDGKYALTDHASLLELKAYRFMAQKLGEEEHVLLHSLRVAWIAGNVFGQVDENTLSLAILHNVFEDTDATLEEVERQFGKVMLQHIVALTEPLYGFERSGCQGSFQNVYFHVLYLAPDAVKAVKLADYMDRLCEEEGNSVLRSEVHSFIQYLNKTHCSAMLTFVCGCMARFLLTSEKPQFASLEMGALSAGG